MFSVAIIVILVENLSMNSMLIHIDNTVFFFFVLFFVLLFVGCYGAEIVLTAA